MFTRSTSIAVVLLSICLSTALAQSPTPVSFLAARIYFTGTSSRSVAVGDFNSNGTSDLAVVNPADGTVSVLLGNGDGTFQAAVNYSVGSQPTWVAAGDFNGDGKVDLVVANAPNSVSVLLGNGDGTFQAPVSYSVGSQPFSLAVGDFNGDGHLDLAVTNAGNNTVSVLLGNGDGTFQAAVSYNVGPEPYSLAVGDFNGDGHPDLAVTNVGDNSVSVLLGAGDGTFSAGGTYSVGAAPQSLAVGDFNGDGRLDLAVTNGGSTTVSVLLGNGDGTFQGPVSYGAGLQPLGVAVGDFNGDGHLDLAVANSGDNTMSVLLGNGDGTFQAPVNFNAGAVPYSVVVGDFNGDGKSDLAVANSGAGDPGGGGVSVLLGNGDGTFPTPKNSVVGNQPISVAVGDFNNDGKPDLAVANSNDNTVSVLVGNGDGTFQRAANYAVGSTPYWVAVGDFNGDGKPDLAVANYDGGVVSVLLGNGDGTFQAAVNYGAGANPESIAVGDFNGDGHLDLAVANAGDDTISVLLGNGDGTFQGSVSYGVGTFPVSVAAADFNNDGKTDLVATNLGDGTLSVLLGNGDGTFQASASYGVGQGPISVAVGDFNGDGHPDLVVVNDFDNTVSTLQGNGDGTFQTPVTFGAGSEGAGSEPTGVVVGDFNGDGHPDLVVGSYGADAVTVFVGNGDGTFQAAENYSAGANPYLLAVGDFNSDGKLDVAVANYGGNTVSILLNTTGLLMAQRITFDGLANQPLGYVPFMVSATASSGLPVSFNSQTNSVCTVSGATVTLVAVGTCTIQATQAGNANYAPATPVNQSFQVTQENQTITFGALANQPFGTAPFPVSATASSGLAVSFNSQTTSVCTVSGATVTLVAVGTCTIQATQAGNANYAPATPVNQSFQVTQESQTITFGALANQPFGTGPFPVSATASSGLAVSFNSQTTSVCTVSGGTVTLVAVGMCTIQATQAGNTNYAPATPVNQSFQVAQGSQTITFRALANKALGAAPFTISATASSGLPVSFNSQTTSVCTVSGTTVTVAALGTCTIQATQAGNANYAPATPVNQSFQVVQPVTISPATLAFGSQGLNSPSNTRTVTVQNNTSTQTSLSFHINGVNGQDFQQTPATTCGSTLAAQSSCTISVLFDPLATGALSATLSFSGTPDQTQPSVNLTGTGVQPVTVSPATLAFGSQGLNSPSNAKTVTVQNNTSTPTSLSFNISGVNGQDFQQTPATTCGSTLAAQSSCTISVLFDPQMTGALSATLSFLNTPDQTQPSVNLTGTGVQPVTVSPATLAFGSQGLNSPSNTKTVTVQNNTSTPTSLSFNISGVNGQDFQQTPATTCGSTLAAQSSCTISVLFDPLATGALSATLSFLGTPDQTQPSVNLTGTGVQPVTVSPATLAFGSQGLNSPSNTKTVTVQNNTSTQTSLSFNINGVNGQDFQQTAATTCGSTMAAQSSCTISVLFDPLATGALSATLSFLGTPDQTQPSVSLTGTGVQPVTVSPATLAFGSQGLNSPSNAKTVTVQNNTNSQTSLSFNINGVDGQDFQNNLAATTCGSTLAAQSSCTISVLFDPLATGALSATLSFFNTPDQTQPSVSLTGTGVQPVTVSPATLAFGAQGLNSPSNAKTVTVQNNTNSQTSLSFNINGVDGQNFQNNLPATTCGSTLAAQSSCTISVLFDPLATGALSATLSFFNTPDQTQPSVNLTGTGVQPVTVSPATLAFGSQGLNNPSNAMTVTVQNNTNSQTPLNFSIGGANPNDFQQTPSTTCGSTLAAQSSCTISVLFYPQMTGALSATLSFLNTPNQTQPSVNLTGTGVQPVTVSPATLAFGSQGLNSPSNAMTMTVQNNTNSRTNFSFALGGANPSDFLLGTTTCGSTLAAQSSCTISAVFDPQAAGVLSATLSFAGTPDQTQPNVSLTGTGVQPVTVSPATLAFGSQGLNNPTNAMVVTVQNNANLQANLSFGLGGANPNDFLIGATTCGSTLAAQSSCTISVQFDPQATGARSALLNFSNTPDTTQPSVSLTGTGTTGGGGQPVTVSPATLAFGSQGLNSPTNAETVTVQNHTNSRTSLSFGLGGTNPNDFRLEATNCGSTLAAQSSCTISVQFDPQATGSRTATLNFSGTPDTTQPSVNLTGTGALQVTVSPATLAFGRQGLNNPTNAMTVTVQNHTSSQTPLNFSIGGSNPNDFQQTAATTCGSTLAAQSSCTISVLFDPQATGSRTATLNFSGTPDTTQPSVSLTGTSVLQVTVSPGSLAFGSQGLNSPTSAMTVTVQNNTNSQTSLTFVLGGANPSDFQLTAATTCGSTLAAQSSCTISAQFDPQAIGSRTATLNFSGTPDTTQPSVNLTGTGVLQVTVSPATLAFGSQGLNSPTNAMTVTVQNNTSSQTSLNFSIGGVNPNDFQLSPASTCNGNTLAAQSTCTISVQFDPQATGSRSATLNFSGTPDTTQPSVSLTGTGVLQVTVSPATLAFGSQGLNSPTNAMTVTIQNNTNSQTSLNFSIGGGDSNDFQLTPTTTCGSTLPAQSSCTISVQFDPQATGSRIATLNFSGTPDTIQPSVSLTGTGVLQVTVSPATLAFGSQGLNSPSNAMTVTVQNNTNSQTSLNFSMGGANPNDFQLTPATTCNGNTLAAQSSCTISVLFDPQATGSRSATLSFFGTLNQSQPSVTLTGTGT
jgi:hypothetical protein